MIYEVESVVAASDEVGEGWQEEESSVAKDVQQPELDRQDDGGGDDDSGQVRESFEQGKGCPEA